MYSPHAVLCIPRNNRVSCFGFSITYKKKKKKREHTLREKYVGDNVNIFFFIRQILITNFYLSLNSPVLIERTIGFVRIYSFKITILEELLFSIKKYVYQYK